MYPKNRFNRLALLGAFALSAVLASAQTFTLNGNDFTYTDSERSFTGILIKPDGNGPFPAVIINHGQNGSASGYSMSKANEFVQWGLVCIAPNLTHTLGGDGSEAGSGNSPENVARGEACLWALSTLGYVDMDRVAIWGHSKGAFATVGQLAAMGSAIRAAGISAGGCTNGGTGSTQAAPTADEADAVVTPMILFHGDPDPVVPPQLSSNLEGVLDGNSVPVSRVTFSTTGLPGNQQHNIHQTDFNDDMIEDFEAWLTTHGMFTVTQTFDGLAEDGWVLESSEFSNVGGSNSNTGGLQLGDDASDRQYRSIISFDTSSLPDGATILSATLQLRRSTLTGTNPFTTHGECRVDIRTGAFGSASTLANNDFEAAATATNVVTGGMSNAATGNAFSTGTLNATGMGAINLTGTTQLRLYFATDDNDDGGADYVSFYSGNNGTSENRPKLIIEYIP